MECKLFDANEVVGFNAAVNTLLNGFSCLKICFMLQNATFGNTKGHLNVAQLMQSNRNTVASRKS